MKQSDETPEAQPVVTLWLDTVSEFGVHAMLAQDSQFYATISTVAPRPDYFPPAPHGSFYILLTARGEDTIWQYAEKVPGVTHTDAFVDEAGTRDKVEARLAEITNAVAAYGLTLRRGKWEA